MSWGFHGMYNVFSACPRAIRCPATIKRFNDTLVKRIDMLPYKDPQIVHFGEGNKAGYTLVQLIHTSNICAHFTEEDNCIYLDVFSCKHFKTEDVKDVIHEYFKPRAIQNLFIHRKAEDRLE
jgi:hypothetical protein